MAIIHERKGIKPTSGMQDYNKCLKVKKKKAINKEVLFPVH